MASPQWFSAGEEMPYSSAELPSARQEWGGPMPVESSAQAVPAIDWSGKSTWSGTFEELKTADIHDANVLFRARTNWLHRYESILDQGKRAEALRQDVRTLCARWLELENVCILAGAGTSRYAGGLLARE